MAVVAHPWTPEEIRIVREGFALNMTAREIAEKLPGRTRNSVIGLRFRLGLAKKNPPQTEGSKRKKRKQDAQVVELNPKADQPATPSVKLTKPEGVVIHLPKPIPVHIGDRKGKEVLLINRRQNQCAYISGKVQGVETKCCGKPTMEYSSWCEEHRRLVYVPKTKAPRHARKSRFSY